MKKLSSLLLACAMLLALAACGGGTTNETPAADTPASILLIAPLQKGLLLRRQIEGEFLLLAHKQAPFPGLTPVFSSCP